MQARTIQQPHHAVWRDGIILDHHFEDITTEAIEDYKRYDGRPFMQYLDAMVETPSARRAAHN